MSEDLKPYRYEPIALSNESTVVAEFLPDALGAREAAYQSEAELEKSFIKALQLQAYDYLSITSEVELLVNLRRQLERLNKITFSDAEWERFFTASIAGANDGILEKTARIQEDHIQVLKRDDGATRNIYLIDKANIHNNTLQVINQYEVEGARANRYDVTVLVNGLPMVHIELKRRGVDIREAFNQINRYQRDSFWAGSGLFEYVQLFVISNGTLTKYYSNTVRDGHLREQSARRGKGGSKGKTSNSFAFTSWWADAKNQPITELMGFTKTFFAKHSLLNVLTKYCVFDVDRKLLVMRPYQIVAAERILQRIATATNHKQLGTVAAGGYIWHTTGSGKTLTSFKAAQLARGLPDIAKVLFVVDRKDLDYQTMREYERFEKGAANSNTSTAVLQRQLEDPGARIIITTIQKLSRFVATNRKHQVYEAHVVVIFDECHRSQFGDMHAEITRVFRRYHLFGFTGTPIFAENAGTGGDPRRRTTQQAFGDKLHTYTIVDAINDKNVLPFRIDYINTIKTSPCIKDKKVSAIDTERALVAPERITQIVGYIREHFDQKTKRSASYRHDSKQLTGFNSLFATASIDAAKRYYAEFAAQKAFIKLFGSILRLKNILTSFDDFAGNEILTDREFQDYQSLYLNLYAEFRATSAAEKESINDDVVFEIELIKQVEINVDYILLLVEQYLKKKGSGDDKEIRATIERAINSSPSLRNKKDLIEQFVDSVNTKAKVDAQWQAFVAAKKMEELERIITEENLNAEAARSFIDNAFRDEGVPTSGTAITKILPPVSRFTKNNGHAAKKQTVLDRLAVFFERYFGLA